jgi:hypothetical protein
VIFDFPTDGGSIYKGSERQWVKRCAEGKKKSEAGELVSEGCFSYWEGQKVYRGCKKRSKMCKKVSIIDQN